jgi:MFS family permease
MALTYLRSKLSDSKTSLVYIMQFKLIDETSALIDKLLAELKQNYKDKRHLVETRRSSKDILIEPLLKEMDLDEASTLEKDQIDKFIINKFTIIENLIEKIDEANNLLRSNTQNWSLNKVKIETNDYRGKRKKSTVMMDYIENEGIFERITPHVPVHIKSKSVFNIWLCMVHTFIYTMNCYIVQPTNASYIERLGSTPFLTGFVLAMTPLAAIFSTFFYSYLCNSNYRVSFVISCLCFIIGNFLYSYADYVQSVWVMGIGRVFIGLGGARVICRRYLLEQVPKDLILHYSILYVGTVCIGMSAGKYYLILGPGFAILLHMLPDTMILQYNVNIYTYPGWFCLFLWILFFLCFLVMFHEDIIQYTKLNVSERIAKSKSEDALRKLNLQYYDDNLVKKDIEDMIKEESTTFSYIAVAFTILTLVLVLLRVSL